MPISFTLEWLLGHLTELLCVLLEADHRMDSARDITTNEIIEAEELWEIVLVDKERYRCIGCGTQILPASYKRGINKVRPYFTLGKSGAHLLSCEIDGIEKQIEHGKRERIGTEQRFPFPYPYKFILTDVRPVIEPNSGDTEPRQSRTANKEPKNDLPTRHAHG